MGRWYVSGGNPAGDSSVSPAGMAASVDADCSQKKRKGIIAPLPVQRGSKYCGKKKRAKLGETEVYEVENWKEDTYKLTFKEIAANIVTVAQEVDKRKLHVHYVRVLGGRWSARSAKDWFSCCSWCKGPQVGANEREPNTQPSKRLRTEAGVSPNASSAAEAATRATDPAAPESTMESDEFQRPKSVREPRTPTPAERFEHEILGHIVYRSWCPHCVAARGRAQGHPLKDPSAEDELPELCIDYCFLGEENETLPYLAGIDTKSGA